MENHAKNCSKELTESHLLSATSIRENSIFADIENIQKTFENINKWLLENGISFKSIEILQPSLEDIFLKLTEAERS